MGVGNLQGLQVIRQQVWLKSFLKNGIKCCYEMVTEVVSIALSILRLGDVWTSQGTLLWFSEILN